MKAHVADAASPLMRDLLAERHAFLAFTRSRVGSGADAEDVLQQALLRAAEHAGDVREPDRARAWFFQILRSVLADHHAKGALRESKIALFASRTDDATSEEAAICGCGLGRLDRIRPAYADILRRVDVADEPLASVAGALGITVNSATVRLHRARKALREQLRSLCGTDSVRACLDCGCDE